MLLKARESPQPAELDQDEDKWTSTNRDIKQNLRSQDKKNRQICQRTTAAKRSECYHSKKKNLRWENIFRKAQIHQKGLQAEDDPGNASSEQRSSFARHHPHVPHRFGHCGGAVGGVLPDSCGPLQTHPDLPHPLRPRGSAGAVLEHQLSHPGGLSGAEGQRAPPWHFAGYVRSGRAHERRPGPSVGWWTQILFCGKNSLNDLILCWFLLYGVANLL